ncbi:hypothetical protein SDC9_69611 [bioreactor metagenome]|uniref:Uncharacterized protein n=1 Tax=bioreactor metagenome TaxID=1076179 RepID=A0A644Y4L8_9ZZZZ
MQLGMLQCVKVMRHILPYGRGLGACPGKRVGHKGGVFKIVSELSHLRIRSVHQIPAAILQSNHLPLRLCGRRGSYDGPEKTFFAGLLEAGFGAEPQPPRVTSQD